MDFGQIDEPGEARSGALAEQSPASARSVPADPGSQEFSRSDLSSEDLDPALAAIIEEITHRIQSGEDVNLEESAASQPEWADTLRSLLPSLRMLSRFRRTEISAPLAVSLPAAVVLPTTFGDFIVRREVGRGGMGIVYEAEQISLSRRVAIKVLSAAAALDPQSLKRFQIEAQAAACLDHEHIVPVYAVGSHNDVPFYAMRFVEGASLAEVVDALRRFRAGAPVPASTSSETGNLAEALAVDLLADRFGAGLGEPVSEPAPGVQSAAYVRAVVRLIAQVARALDHAHEQGVLHRDIKPANLLLDRSGKLWVTDFGLARIIGSNTLTIQGALTGTLRYMSPEQILGKRALVDRRSDLYSLGATLYELLSLELAIDGQERWEILARIDSEEPRPVGRLNPAVPRDLAIVVAKAMAKDVSSRYSTAQDLGDDLRRLLDGRPIIARRAGPREQLIRWGRRYPAVATLIAALVVVFFGGFAAVTMQWRRAEAEANRANHTAQAETKALSEQSRLRIDAQTQAAARDFDHALNLARQGDVDHGLLWMAEALKLAPAENPELERIARANLASWTDQVPPLRAILEHRGPVKQAVFRSDGRAILTASSDGTARVWDSFTGKAIGQSLEHGDQILTAAYSADDRLILTAGSDGKARIWDSATGQPAGPALTHGAAISAVGFGPSGRHFSTLSKDCARIWNIAASPPIGRILGKGAFNSVDFSPDGRWLLTAGVDGVARLWDSATGEPAETTFRHADTMTFAIFSPDQRLISTTGNRGTRLWNAISGQALGPTLSHDPPDFKPVFSANGKLLLTAGRTRTARLWNTATGRAVSPLLHHAGAISAAAFSPDGMLVVTASRDRTARLWDTATGQPVGSPMRHRLYVRSVSFSPDGKLVLTASMDGTAKLWEVGAGEFVANAPRIEDQPDDSHAVSASPTPGVPLETAIFSPDRKRVVLASQAAGQARLVDTFSGAPIGPPMIHRWSTVRAIAFSPDGSRFATSSHPHDRDEADSTGNTCQIWDAATSRPCAPLLPHVNYVATIAFRPDGKALATGDYSGAVHLWDVETGVPLRSPLRTAAIVLSLAFSPDGLTLAAGTAEPTPRVVLWDLATGRPRGEPVPFKRSVTRLTFSPDGRRLAVASTDTTVRLVEVATGRALGEPLHHAESIHALAFSPDSRVLVSVSFGPSGTSVARLWNVDTCRPASPELAQPSVAPDALAVSPDGTVFVTGCRNGSVYLWDMASARPIGPPRFLGSSVVAVAFLPAGRTLLAVDDRGHVRSWPVAVPPDEPVGRLIGRLKARSGQELDSAGALVVLDPASWRRHQDANGDLSLACRSPDDQAWHDARALVATAAGDGWGARWHLDRMISVTPRNGSLRARLAEALLIDGDPESARSEIAHAMEFGPRDSILDQLFHWAEDFRASGDPQSALLLIDQVLTARPADWLVHARRAEVMADLGRVTEREAERAEAVKRGADIPFLIRLADERSQAGQWNAAAQLYDRAIAQGTVPYDVWSQAAIAHLEIDDLAGYRRICATMRNRHPAEIPERWVWLALASVCGLGPGGVGADGKAQTWAETLLARISPDRVELRHRALSLTGIVLYRSAQFHAAIDRIKEGITADHGELTPEDAVVLAMAYHESGEPAKALEMLAGAVASPAAGEEPNFWDTQNIRLLRREAERLILDRPFPIDPFAR